MGIDASENAPEGGWEKPKVGVLRRPLDPDSYIRDNSWLYLVLLEALI